MSSRKRRVSDNGQGNTGITSIHVDKLDPNPWNPNRMSTVAFGQYVAEVRRLGTLPKPIICRPVDERLQIIDGEHAWRAAQEVGLTEVPCEVLADADDFESMRQTYKRNRGGKDNAVLLGQMFQRMMKQKKLSARGLAKEMGVSETTVRNNLTYVQAAEVRTRFAQENRDAEIAKLTKRQVQMYVGLADELRDKWLDAGGDLGDLEDLCEELDAIEASKLIVNAGLADLAKPGYVDFRKSIAYLLGLAQWCRAHWLQIKRAIEYVRPVAELGMPVGLLHQLPCKTVKGRVPAPFVPKDRVTVLLSPQDWRKILTDAAARSSNPKGQLALVQTAVRVALRKANVDLGAVCGPDVAESVQLVEAAPAFIRDADCLTLEEKRLLATIKVDAPEQMVSRAKEMAVEYLQQRRGASTAAQAKKNGPPEPDFGNKVEQVFPQCLKELCRDERLTNEERLFADREKLLKAILLKLAMSEAIKKAQVNGTPAAEVLVERLIGLGEPEFVLLASLVLRSSALDDAAGRWLTSVKGAISDSGEACPR